MGRIIKRIGLSASAFAMSFATVATPVTSTYATGSEPECAQSGDYSSCFNPWPESYAARNGGESYFTSPIAGYGTEGISYKIEDESIAKIVQEVRPSGDSTYTATLLKGLKTGKTNLAVILDSTKEVLKRLPIEIYNITVPADFSLAVGTSRTFNVTAGDGMEIVNVDIPTEEVFQKAATVKNNGGGSYTITAKSIPYGVFGMVAPGEEAESMYYPFFPIFVKSKNKTTGATFTDNVTVTLYEQNTKDDAAIDNSATEIVNEAKLADVTASLMDVVAAQNSTVKNGDTVSLDGGAIATIADAAGLREAVQDGKTIEVALSSPEEIKNVPSEVSTKMESKLPENTKGARYLDINVLIRAAGKVFGKLVETGAPLTVTIDVSSDPEVPAGYVRNYYMVRMHDGAAESIDVEYSAADKTIKGDSSKFSTYLVAYKDTEAAKAPNSGANNTVSSGTASVSYAGLIAMAVLVSLLGASVIIRKNA